MFINLFPVIVKTSSKKSRTLPKAYRSQLVTDHKRISPREIIIKYQYIMSVRDRRVGYPRIRIRIIRRDNSNHYGVYK